ncbi:hypothetical protein RQP46_003465 [Phenoliferia psychrophenolica]
MLSSATVTFNFGIAGAFWFAAGCVVQISFFAFLAIQSKMKAPRAHTLLEIIRTRYGAVAHVVYMGLCLIDNIISVANMLLGASAVVSALTGISVTAANFLLPFGVVAYTVTGGLKATFLTDWVHTVIILIIIIYFGLLTFSTDLIRSPTHLWELVNAVSDKVPVVGNGGGSYFTMKSLGGIEFGIIHTLTAAVPGYILGGVAYFCIPFSLGTIMGLAGIALQSHPSFPTYPNPMTASDINNGLVVPFVAQTLGGKGAAGAALALVFMAVTSTTSSQLIAVSSISAFDIYKTWVNPRASDSAVVRVSHFAVVGFGIFMATFSTAIFYGGASLGWTIYMLGTIVCPAMIPILLTLLWDRQTKLAAIVSPLVGMAGGIAVWLGTSYHFGGEISYGTVTSAFLPLPISVLLSLLVNPYKYDWADLNVIEDTDNFSIDVKEDDHRGQSAEGWSTEDRAYMKRGALFSGFFSLFLFLAVWVIWPLPMYGSGYIFSAKFFDGWIRVGQIWTWVALGIAGILPVLQGRHSIKKVVWGVLGIGELTTLLDLPTEILLRIGRTLSPLGGRSAANLRLTCSRLAQAIAPVVWSSIKLPTDPKERGRLFAHLIRHTEVRPFITSITYPLPDGLSLAPIAAAILGTLPSLKRLHIEGHNGPLPDDLFDAIAGLESLRTLSLAKVDLTGRHLYDNWPATTRALALKSCTGAYNMFYSPETEEYESPRLSSFTFKPVIPDDDIYRIPWKPVVRQSITLRIIGLKGSSNAEELVKLLNWIGAGNLKELSIPVAVALVKDATALRHLSLPSLETLKLGSRYPNMQGNRLGSSCYSPLIKFLSTKSLPRLIRVHLSGLFDKSSVTKIAGKDLQSLAVSHPYLYSLLGALLSTNVVELTLSNADEHVKTDVQCLFRREKGEKEWISTRVELLQW